MTVTNKLDREIAQVLAKKTTKKRGGKRWTLGPGREIFRDGKPVLIIARDPNSALMPSEVDTITHRICAMLNKSR